MVKSNSEAYTDQQRKDIALDEYNDYQFGKPVKIDDNKTTIGYVAQVVNDPASGLQAYVVTDQKPPSNPPSKEWMNQQQHVTVLYQGSQDGTDWVANNIPEGLFILDGDLPGGLPPEVPVPQFAASSNLLQDVLSEYGHADVDVYGHSLGSMDGQYALADLTDEQMRRVHGYLYEGPNIWDTLTPEQKVQAMKYAVNHRVHQYVDWRDLVGDWGGARGRLGDLTILNSKNAGGSDPYNWFKNQHGMDGYRFNDDHSLMTFNSVKGYYKSANVVLDALAEDRKELADANGGKLTGNEKIWLDEQEAAAVTAGMRGLVSGEVQDLDGAVASDESKAEEEWSGTLSDARWFGGNLSDDEIMDALRGGGATKETICNVHKRRLDSAQNAFHQAASSFDDLAVSIDSAIDQLVSSDAELAGQISKLGTK